MESDGTTATPDLRVAILEASLDLFVQKGYGSTTVDEIAGAANVGVATIYRRWPDKAAIANELLASIVDDCLDVVAVDDGGTAKQRFLRFWRAVWAYGHEHPQRLVYVEGNVHTAYITADNLARKEKLAAATFELLESFDVRATPELAAALMMSALVGVLRAGIEADCEDLGERLWAAVRHS